MKEQNKKREIEIEIEIENQRIRRDEIEQIEENKKRVLKENREERRE